jgi:hypothetical protein
MKRLSIPNLSATLAVGLFFLIANVAHGLYAARGRESSAAFALLSYVGAAWTMSYWIHSDYLRLGVREPLDLGWFVFLTWPLALPYHLIKTRGLRGLFILAGFTALFLGTYLVGALIFFLAKPNSGAP